MKTLKEQAFISTIWSAIERFGTQILQFVVVIILARLLSPTDFGLVGMITIFIALARVFIDSGLGTALIRKKNVKQIDYSTVFLFNIFVSIIIYLILFVSAPFISEFYETSKLIPIIRILSLNFIIGALGSIHITVLTKKLDFKTQSKISIISNFLSGGIAIALAYYQFGVWALVFQALSYSVISTILYWLFNTWKPVIAFSWKAFNELFGFSSKLLISILIDTIFQNIYLVIIGKWFNASELGYYTQAKKIQETPSLTINNIIQRVSFPVFANLQEDEARLKEGMKKTIRILVFILFPVMLGLMSVSNSFIRSILTEKWIESIIYLKLLCIVGFLYPLQSINLNILNVKGRSDIFLKVELIRKINIIISIAIGMHWGILGLVIGNVLASFINYLIVAIVSGNFINYKLKEQLTDVLPYMFATIIMISIIETITPLLIHLSDIQTLAIQIFAGLISYSAMAILFKLKAFIEISKLIRPITLKFLNR